MNDLPKPYLDFKKSYPEIEKSYVEMGHAVHQSGPIEKKTRELLKLAISAGAQKEGAVHSHTRKALDAGVSHEEIRHVILLTLPTLGMPSMMAAMTWVDEILKSHHSQSGK